MKTSSTWNFRSIAGMIIMGLVLAAMVGSIDVGPALAKNKGDHKSMGRHDNGRYDHRGRGYDHNRRYYGHYGHRERDYYPPPPVVYAPPPPPGIGIFFPPIFIHP
ncbi:MAG: hypothetical protein ABFD82_05535 [Syntrophaceae bacterium]